MLEKQDFVSAVASLDFWHEGLPARAHSQSHIIIRIETYTHTIDAL